MLKKLLGVLVITSHLPTIAYGGYNGKILDAEASEYVSKICSGVPIPKAKIRENLDFVDDEDNDSIPFQVENFNELYGKIKKNVQEENFLKFAEVCKNIYDEEANSATKIATHLLLEKVSEKCTKILKELNKRAERSKQASIHEQDENLDNKILQNFFNANSSVSLDAQASKMNTPNLPPSAEVTPSSSAGSASSPTSLPPASSKSTGVTSLDSATMSSSFSSGSASKALNNSLEKESQNPVTRSTSEPSLDVDQTKQRNHLLSTQLEKFMQDIYLQIERTRAEIEKHTPTSLTNRAKGLVDDLAEHTKKCREEMKTMLKM